MSFIRRHLSWLLTAWLVCQVTALGAPVVLAATGSAPVEELCTCEGGDHETCPMHHSTPTSEGGTVCGMRACAAPLDVALLSLAGGAGIVPSAVAIRLVAISAAVTIPDAATVQFDLTHDTPPPRL